MASLVGYHEQVVPIFYWISKETGVGLIEDDISMVDQFVYIFHRFRPLVGAITKNLD